MALTGFKNVPSGTYADRRLLMIDKMYDSSGTICMLLVYPKVN